MSDTNPVDSTPAATETESTAKPGGAVDTGRRIDPASLQKNTIRRGRPAPPEGSIAAPEGVEGEPGIRVIENPQQNKKGAVVDAAAIAARAAAQDTGAGDERPRGPRRDRNDRNDRGPRRDRPEGQTAEGQDAGGEQRPRNDRGPRGDRGHGKDGKGRSDRGDRRERHDDKNEVKAPRESRIDYSGLKPIVVSRDEDVGDFAAMLAESGGVQRKTVKLGDKLKVTVIHIGSDSIFFEVSPTQQGHATRGDYLDEKTGEVTVKPGDVVAAFVVGLKEGILLSPRLGKDQIDLGMLEEARNSGIPVDGTITGANKGGYEVALGAARGFCPLGQIDINFIEDANTMIGKTLSFLIKEVKEGGKNIVLSRRALLEREKAEKAKLTRERIAIGAVLEGTVTRIQQFGAFVDLGGIDGLIPTSELSFGRVASPEEFVKVGQVVTVEVVRIEPDPKRSGQERIGLSMKSQLTDPFIANAHELVPGAQLVGRVARLEAYGAFVELFPGVDGLVHVSEITDRRIRHPQDVLNVDEHVQVRIKEIDADKRRISLTMREANEEQPEAAATTEQKPSKPRARFERGMRFNGIVDRIEKFGVFLNLFAEGGEGGEPVANALMPAVETGTQRGTDLNKAFPIGTRVAVLVIDIDDRGRLKVSKTAREQADERAVVDQYKTDKGGSGKTGLGTFADLLKKFNS